MINSTELIFVESDDGLTRNISREQYHVLIMLMRGRAQRLVLKAGEPDGWEASRLLLSRYEPLSTAAGVAKLVGLLSTSFSGDLVDAVTDFEKACHVVGAQGQRDPVWPCQLWSCCQGPETSHGLVGHGMGSEV